MGIQHRFESPRGAPPGLGYSPGFVTDTEEANLLESLRRLDWDGRGMFRRRGRVVRRREIDFIQDYGRHSRSIAPGPPLPTFLEPIRERCARAVLIKPERFQQVIVSLYRQGAGIDWHVDSTKAFGDTICGLSLGSACTMQFRPVNGNEIWRLELRPRSLLVLRGPSRFDYQHRISLVKTTRYSVTLRTIAECLGAPCDE